MKNTQSVFLFVALLFLFSCGGSDDDMFTITISNPYDFTIEVMSNSINVTSDISAKGSETFSGDVNETHGVSLSAMEKGDNTILGGMNGSLVFYPEAGEKYEWRAGSPSVGKEGDPSSIDCDIEDYDGPEFDIQVDSQCKMAYMYDCVGDIEARDATCKLYYEYGNSVWTGSGSLPDCPYCN